MADSTRDETEALRAELAQLLAAMTVPELKALLGIVEAQAARRRARRVGRSNPGKITKKKRRPVT
jgi:hypothetical protein